MHPAAPPPTSELLQLPTSHLLSSQSTSTEPFIDNQISYQQPASKTTCDLSPIDLWLHGQEEPAQLPITSSDCSRRQSLLNPQISASTYQSRKRKRELLSEDYGGGHNLKTPPQSLTEANLQLLTGHSLKKSHKMSTKITSTATTQGLSIKVLLTENGMPMDNLAIKSTDAYRAVMETSNVRIARGRHSPEKVAKAGSFELLAAKYKTRSEQTFIERFFLPLTQGSRNILIKDDSGKEIENPIWKERDWDDDGIDINTCQPFLRNSLPKVDTRGDKNYKKLLDSHERIKNPNPDRCYGLAEETFTMKERRINYLLHKYIGISNGIYHPSIVIEFGLHKSITDLEAQCARGGAALVNAVRSVRLAAGEDIMIDGADQDSLIYTFAISGETAYLHVNWAFVEGSSTTFHMHLVKGFCLRGGHTIMEMRGALNNLLDWTVGDRQTWIKGLLQKIDAKGNKLVVPTPITLESTTGDSSVVIVGNENESEDELAGGMASLVSGSGTPNKKRKQDGPAA